MQFDPNSGTFVNQLALSMLVAELGVLSDLTDWLPVGGRLECLRDALLGTDSISKRDVDTLRLWAGRWQKISPVVKEFYSESAPADPSISMLLEQVLRGQRINPKLRGLVRRRYEEITGETPSYDITPKFE